MVEVTRLGFFLAGISGALLLASCGGGGSASSSGAVSALSEINGAVVKGPVLGSKVCLHKLNPDGSRGAAVTVAVGSKASSETKVDGDGCFVTAADGQFSLSFPSSVEGPFIVESTGGRFCADESVSVAGLCQLGAPMQSITSGEDGQMRGLVDVPTTGVFVPSYLTPISTAAFDTLPGVKTAVAFKTRFAQLSEALSAGESLSPESNPVGTTAMATFATLGNRIAGGETLGQVVRAVGSLVPVDTTSVASGTTSSSGSTTGSTSSTTSSSGAGTTTGTSTGTTTSGSTTTTTPSVVYPVATKVFSAPWTLVSTGPTGLVNDDTVFGSTPDGISDDGSKVVFTTWSAHAFGLATKTCSFDWIYVRDVDKKTLTLPVSGLDGKILCGYESSPGISGNGKFVVFRGSHPAYSHSTSSVSGFFRSQIGYAGYDPVNRKGLEFSFENNGTLKVGTIIIGSRVRARPDTDGNSIVFSMKYLENIGDVGKQYNTSLFANPMLRLDKGAQSVGNQLWARTHDDTTYESLNYEVSGNGAYVFYSELNDQKVMEHRIWDMLARADLGDPFQTLRASNPTANAYMCGVSSDGRYVLVNHAFKVPLSPGRTLAKASRVASQFSRYDRVKKEFEYVAVSEEQSRSLSDGRCDYFANGSFSRQMSKDANRVFWRSGGHIFVRDIALQSTLKIPFSGTAYDWTISGDGRYILLTTDIASDGTKYLNKYGSKTSQLYRIGPINATDFGSTFSVASFESKLNQ
jgi:hypothetical protein